MSEEDKTKITTTLEKEDELKPVESDIKAKIPKCPALPPSNKFYKVLIAICNIIV